MLLSDCMMVKTEYLRLKYKVNYMWISFNLKTLLVVNQIFFFWFKILNTVHFFLFYDYYFLDFFV